jgi:hypothetical protein
MQQLRKMQPLFRSLPASMLEQYHALSHDPIRSNLVTMLRQSLKFFGVKLLYYRAFPKQLYELLQALTSLGAVVMQFGQLAPEFVLETHLMIWSLIYTTK